MTPFKRNKLAAAVAGTLAMSAGSAIAAFTEVTEGNPFDAVTTNGTFPSVTMMDLDADGDLDLVLHHQDDGTEAFPYAGTNYISVYENVGSEAAAEFAHVADSPGYGSGVNITVSPFANDYNYYGHPVTAFDADGDDDLDFIAGVTGGCCGVNANFGLVESTVSGEVTGVQFYGYSTSGYGYNVFYGSNLAPNVAAYGGSVSHAPGNLDNDLDMDLITLDDNTLRVWSNDGVDGNTAGIIFNELTGDDFPFASSNIGSSAYYGGPMVLHDVDGDNDLDLVLGTRAAGDLRLFRNEGSASVPDFVEVEDTTGTVDVTAAGWAAPTFADIDDDGDDDLIIATRVDTTSSIRLFLSDAADEPEPEPEPEVDDGPDLALLAAIEAADDDDDDVLGSSGLLGIFGALGALLMRRRRR